MTAALYSSPTTRKWFYMVSILTSVIVLVYMNAALSLISVRLLRTHVAPYRGTWVDPDGDLQTRLTNFTHTIDQVRLKIWKKRGNKPWQDIRLDPSRNIISDSHPYFIQNITRLDYVTTVFLKWRTSSWVKISYWTSLTDNSNILVNKFYNWVGSAQLCSWLTVEVISNKINYRKHCNSDMRRVIEPSYIRMEDYNTHEKALQEAQDNKWYIPNLSSESPYVTYINIIQDVGVTMNGIVVKENNLIVPYSCYNWKSGLGVVKEDFDDVPEYQEVFVVAQTSGPAVYHSNIEQLPRLGAYLDFLKRNPTVKVHMGKDAGSLTKAIFNVIGIPYDNIVYGTVKAKVVYIPQGIPCLYGSVFHFQTISAAYREAIIKKYGHQPRRSIVVIHRSGRRRLLNSAAFEQVIKEAAAVVGLRFELFNDAPSPPVHEAMMMFNRAVMIIGPHGAGMYNMLYSRPGTYVIEILSAPPRVTMLFQTLAYLLGHRYYGMAGSGQDVLTVHILTFKNILKYYMPHAIKLAENATDVKI